MTCSLALALASSSSSSCPCCSMSHVLTMGSPASCGTTSSISPLSCRFHTSLFIMYRHKSFGNSMFLEPSPASSSNALISAASACFLDLGWLDVGVDGTNSKPSGSIIIIMFLKLACSKPTILVRCLPHTKISITSLYIKRA